MAKSYITTATTTQVTDTPARKVLITVNKTDAQTIKVIDNNTGTTANVATITDPLVGARFEYYDFTVGVRIVTSATCDITVNTYGGFGAR